MRYLVAALAAASALAAGAHAEAGIPQWVKGNAGLWSDGAIGDAEFAASMQYLLSEGILRLPVPEVRAAESSAPAEDRAASFAVHFSQGPFGDGVSVYSYSLYSQISRTTTDTSLDYMQYAETTPSFTLRSLPSTDKAEVYEVMERYLDHDHSLSGFMVNVEILTGGGQILQTWKYEDCKIVDYWVYTNTDKTKYNFSDEDGMEIRDAMVISCIHQRLDV